MTPNPNPSPESVKLVASALCRAAGMDPEGGARTGYSWINHEADARTLLATLSAQTLPAPGEVETNRRYLCELLRREGRHSGIWFADKLIEAAGLIEASTFVPTVTEDARAAFYAESCVAVQRMEGDQVVTIEGFMRAIAKLNTPTPATVAAANDEGVARDTVAFVQDWLMNADYDPTQFDKDFAVAIDARVNAAYEAAAKVADDYEPFTGDPAYDAATDVAAVTIGAAIRLLSQGGGK